MQVLLKLSDTPINMTQGSFATLLRFSDVDKEKMRVHILYYDNPDHISEVYSAGTVYKQELKRLGRSI